RGRASPPEGPVPADADRTGGNGDAHGAGSLLVDSRGDRGPRGNDDDDGDRRRGPGRRARAGGGRAADVAAAGGVAERPAVRLLRPSRARLRRVRGVRTIRGLPLTRISAGQK